MPSLMDLFVRVVGDNSSFKQSMQDSRTELSSFAVTAESVTSRVAGLGQKLLGTIGFGAIGAGALAAAHKFEGAFVQIQRSTGATGEQLRGLESSFTSIYRKTAASSEDVAAAMSNIASRTGLTGKALEDVTLKMIKLAKTQREDVTAIAPLVTRVFGDWSIQASQAAQKMDYLRVVAQQTGTTVSAIASTLVYAGAPLRALGYDYEKAAALIGKFEKEGVNTQLVLGGMKAILGKFAKEGIEDTATAWQGFIDKVRSGKVGLSEIAQTAGEFGVGRRAAVDLFRAIQEGRFSIDQTVAAFRELATQGGPQMETLATRITKVRHQIEALVASHYQLISVIGFTYPLWGKALAGVASGLSTFVTAITGQVLGLKAAETAIVSYSAKCGALSGTAAAAGGAFTSLASRIGLVGIAITGATAAFVAWRNLTKDYKPEGNPVLNSQPGFVFSGFNVTPSAPTSAPHRVFGPTAPAGYLYEETPGSAKTAPYGPERIAQDFATLGLRDLRLDLDAITGALSRLAAAGKLTPDQIRQVRDQIADLRTELQGGINDFTKYGDAKPFTGALGVIDAAREKISGAHAEMVAMFKAIQEYARSPFVTISRAAASMITGVPPQLIELQLRLKAIDDAAPKQFFGTKAYDDLTDIGKALDKVGIYVKAIDPQPLRDVERVIEQMGGGTALGLPEWLDKSNAALKALGVTGRSDIVALRGHMEALGESLRRGAITQEEYNQGFINYVDNLRRAGYEIDGFTQKIYNQILAQQRLRDRIRETGQELARAFSSGFENIERGLAYIAFNGGKVFKQLADIAKRSAEDIFASFLHGLFKPLEQQFENLGRKIGEWLGGLFGKGASGGTAGVPNIYNLPTTAATVPWFPGSTSPVSGSGPGGSVGNAASSGFSSVFGMVTGAVSAVSSFIGNFQFAGMNKSLDVLVNHTLRIFNELSYFRADAWTREAHWYDRTSDMWRTLLDIKDLLGSGSGGAGKGGFSLTMNNVTIYGTTPQNIAAAIFQQAELAGALG